MKMVKTFIKTQHQHVMPPEKGKKESKKKMYKANELGLSPAQVTGDPDLIHSFRTYQRTREEMSRRHSIQSTTQPITFLCFSVVSLKI